MRLFTVYDYAPSMHVGMIREQWSTLEVSLPIPKEAAADWSLFSRSQVQSLNVNSTSS